MTAHNLISDIFSRSQTGIADNMRRITRPQLNLLIKLIGENEESGAVQRGSGGSLVWMPRGLDKYVITEDPRGNKHTLTHLSNLIPTGMGSLF
jgi:hypothetical protein